ncbi:parathyroid hormone 1b [Clupea harengus]|uniref:Parathyroid hormone n=1 Tax=Clupea harengus TaxID=7950 RepID=A0A6P3VYJ8_CLUHA|nr:parathyroid hormone 1b [Clupea harengus]
MVCIRGVGKLALLIGLCWLCSSVQGHPLSRRSISEVQLMHNVREHKQVVERQDWLQVKLKNILSPSPNDSQKGKKGKYRTLFPLEPLSDLT